MKLDKYYIFCISIAKLQKKKKKLKQFNTVMIIMEENMVIIKEPKTSYFDFDWPKNFDENFKHEFKFIIKSNKFLVEHKMKNKIEQLLSKYKHGINNHKHEKQQNE